MSVSYSSYVVVGIQLSKLFIKLDEKSEEHDEFDKFGKKTGKTFKTEELVATMPNGREVIISNKRGNHGWEFNFYNSLGFDGCEYSREDKIVHLKLTYSYYETTNLDNIIIGIVVAETSEYDKQVDIVEEDKTNNAIRLVGKELAELYGYLDGISLHLVSLIS